MEGSPEQGNLVGNRTAQDTHYTSCFSARAQKDIPSRLTIQLQVLHKPRKTHKELRFPKITSDLMSSLPDIVSSTYFKELLYTKIKFFLLCYCNAARDLHISNH